jgi:hypothetical protein
MQVADELAAGNLVKIEQRGKLCVQYRIRGMVGGYETTQHRIWDKHRSTDLVL